MGELKKKYLYLIISLALCIILSWNVFNILRQSSEAEYRSLSVIASLIEICLGTIFVTAIAIFFQRDRFFKSRTIFIYIFSGVLNLSIAAVFLLFVHSNSDHDSLILSLSLPLLIIGSNIIWNTFKATVRTK